MGKPQKHKHSQISFCPILGPCPTLGTFASGNFLEDWATFTFMSHGKCWHRAKSRLRDETGFEMYSTGCIRCPGPF